MTLAQLVLADLAADPTALEELRMLLGTGSRDERLLKSDEAADLLGINRKTLTRLAGEGRISGAVPHGARYWRFKASELALLPPTPSDIRSIGGGRGIRTPGASPATAAIRGPKAA